MATPKTASRAALCQNVLFQFVAPPASYHCFFVRHWQCVVLCIVFSLVTPLALVQQFVSFVLFLVHCHIGVCACKHFLICFAHCFAVGILLISPKASANVTRGSGVEPTVTPAPWDPGEDAGVTSLCFGLPIRIHNIGSKSELA